MNRKQLEAKMMEIMDVNTSARYDQLPKVSGLCADVAIQYAIDVLTDVSQYISHISDAKEIETKIKELQSLLKQPQP